MSDFEAPGFVADFVTRGDGRAGLAFADLLDLRSWTSSAEAKAAAIGVFVAEHDAALTLVPRGDWPALTGFRSVPKAGGQWTVVRFARPVPVAELVRELGLQAVWPDRSGDRGVRVVTGDDPVDEALPPDVVVGAPWPASEIARQPALVLDSAPEVIDERVLNPIGFLVDVEGPVVELASLDLRRGATPAMVTGLRSARGVRVMRWDDAALRTVRGLACACVPVVASAAPDSLGSDVAAAITAPVDLDDALAREEHSLVLRRAALEAFSGWAVRRELGRRAGVPVAAQPSVSIVLATKRADMVEHALAQIAGQRGVESLELVLAPHGFDVPVAQVQHAVGPAVSVQVVPQPDDALFGDVLDAAARASGGDVVLKMDDDDWYAPDAIADLLRARAYSGAELVGMPPEFHYLTEQDLTVTRGHPSELYTTFVAGGTMLVDRAMLREVGGFRSVRKFVDAQLLDGVLAAGGAVYRTHGLGYVLRRNPTGHTWAADLDFLLDPARVRATYPGFHPSRLLTAT